MKNLIFALKDIHYQSDYILKNETIKKIHRPLAIKNL
jgi:hypothetical protein